VRGIVARQIQAIGVHETSVCVRQFSDRCRPLLVRKQQSQEVVVVTGAHPGVCLAVMTGPFVSQVGYSSTKADEKISNAATTGL